MALKVPSAHARVTNRSGLRPRSTASESASARAGRSAPSSRPGSDRQGFGKHLPGSDLRESARRILGYGHTQSCVDPDQAGFRDFILRLVCIRIRGSFLSTHVLRHRTQIPCIYNENSLRGPHACVNPSCRPPLHSACPISSNSVGFARSHRPRALARRRGRFSRPMHTEGPSVPPVRSFFSAKQAIFVDSGGEKACYKPATTLLQACY